MKRVNLTASMRGAQTCVQFLNFRDLIDRALLLLLEKLEKGEDSSKSMDKWSPHCR